MTICHVSPCDSSGFVASVVHFHLPQSVTLRGVRVVVKRTGIPAFLPAVINSAIASMVSFGRTAGARENEGSTNARDMSITRMAA